MRIAVTGGIAEGKSTVLGYIREAGYPTASADEIARQVFERESVQSQLKDLLGGGEVTRESVRLLIDDAASRREVNRITHPLILEELRHAEAVAIEVPLLIETALMRFFDRIWVVTCGPEEQLRRLTKRLGDPEDAEKLIRTQLPTSAKCLFADRIVRTNSDPDTVRSYVIDALRADLAPSLA